MTKAVATYLVRITIHEPEPEMVTAGAVTRPTNDQVLIAVKGAIQTITEGSNAPVGVSVERVDK